jgi:hypothetical protein
MIFAITSSPQLLLKVGFSNYKHCGYRGCGTELGSFALIDAGFFSEDNGLSGKIVSLF